MKAIVLKIHGGPETLLFEDIATPEPKGNEVLVRLKAAAVNHLDIWVRTGHAAYPVKPPHVPGADGAGVVEKIGPDVEGISVGERVAVLPGLACGECPMCRKGFDNQCDSYSILGAKHWGTYAEYVAVPDQNIIPIPDTMTFEEAAAFPLAYLTAWHMLVGRAKIQAGETVLIVGASAGVAVAAVQIAKLKGARALAVTTSADKVNSIKSLGAEAVFLSEKGGGDFGKWVVEKTASKGADVVFEHVGAATWEASVRSLGKYGRLVTCGATSGADVKLDLRYVFSRSLSIFGARMGTSKDFRELSNEVFSGRLKPRTDKIFPLAEAAEAHRHMEARRHVGKIVLQIS